MNNATGPTRISSKLELLPKLIRLMALIVFTPWSILTIEALPSPTPLTIDSAHVGLRNKTTGVVIPWECHVCEPGSGLSVECGRTVDIGTYIGCVKCRKGVTFSEKRDIGQCTKCTVCSSNEIQTGKCNVNKDTVKCFCKDEFYRDEGTKDCKPCSWCCHDNINHVVEKCKNFLKLPLARHCAYQDAKQCAPTPKTTNSAETLHQWSEEKDVPDGKGKVNSYNTMNIPTQQHPRPPQSGPSTHTTTIIVIVVLPCCVLIFGAIYTRSRQSSARRLCQQRHEEERIPLQILNPPTSEAGLEEIPISSNNSDPEQSRGANEQNAIIPEQSRGANEQNAIIPEQSRGANEQNAIIPEQSRGANEQNAIIPEEAERKRKKGAIHSKYGQKVDDIPHGVMHEACIMLTYTQKLKGNDYRAIAGAIGLDHQRIAYISDPDNYEKRMMNVFEAMIAQGKTINEFVDILYEIERYDVVNKMYEMACNTD